VAPVWLEQVAPPHMEQVARHADAELAPVCAIVGGVVASEVIKIISGKGAPINNAFFFDALQTSEG
jgi:ubiquitin-like 1-activating enzyme E1 A